MKAWLAAAAAVFLIGLAADAVVYLTADEDVVSAMRPEDSRMYRRELEHFGGKANVLFDDFLRWFDGLWHGKKLGVTIGWLGVLASLAIVFVGRLREERK